MFSAIWATICRTFLWGGGGLDWRVCVADGAPELATVCHFTTRRLAGRDAVREVVELILNLSARGIETKQCCKHLLSNVFAQLLRLRGRLHHLATSQATCEFTNRDRLLIPINVPGMTLGRAEALTKFG